MRAEFLKISIEIAIVKAVHTGGVFVKTDMSERTKGTANAQCGGNRDNMKLVGQTEKMAGLHFYTGATQLFNNLSKEHEQLLIYHILWISHVVRTKVLFVMF